MPVSPQTEPARPLAPQPPRGPGEAARPESSPEARRAEPLPAPLLGDWASL